MIWIALAYHLASRLAYVLYVGLTLKRQDRTECLTRRYGVEGGFQRFRRVAAFVMANDAVSLAVLCLVSAGTLRVGLPRGLAIAVGAVLVVVGVSTKVWAARTLRDGYYWRNFFAPEERVVPTTAWPSRPRPRSASPPRSSISAPSSPSITWSRSRISSGGARRRPSPVSGLYLVPPALLRSIQRPVSRLDHL